MATRPSAISRILRKREAGSTSSKRHAPQESPGENAIQASAEGTSDPGSEGACGLVSLRQQEASRDSKYEVDIVAVHGLGGGAYKTWTHSSGTQWLTDLLLEDMPTARVFTFGYDSAFVFSRETSRLRENARALLEDIRVERTSPEERARPLIFICHSMGGIVVKQALILARNDERLYPGLATSIRSILFLGTPHRGSNAASYANILLRLANVFVIGSQLSRLTGPMRTELLQGLESNAEELLNIAQDFRVHTDHIHITSFIEQKNMRGLNERIVDDQSGFVGASTERIVPMLNCDHREICKYSERNSNYKKVLNALREGAIADGQQAASNSSPLAVGGPAAAPLGPNITTTFTASNNRGLQVGQNIGVINFSTGADRYNEPERIYDVPDLLSPRFSGRNEVLRNVQDLLEGYSGDSPARCVIYGMHGLGKTQAALRYADQAYREQRYSYIFWISAASVDKLVQGFSKLSEMVGFRAGGGSSQTDRCAAARIWLEDDRFNHGKAWLLLLDNANSDTAVYLREMLPRKNNRGHILATTRTKQNADSIASAFGEKHFTIELSKFSLSDAIGLLLDMSELNHDELTEDEVQTASEFVRSVGHLPLAVSQAASLLVALGRSISKLAKVYQSHEIGAALEWESGLSRYEHKSIIATYSHTLAQLEQSPSGTIGFLRILTFLDPESISLQILKEGCIAISDSPALDDRLRELRNLFNSSINLAKAVQHLQGLSLITLQNEKNLVVLRIHDLVRLVLQTILMNQPNERQAWFSFAISILDQLCQTVIDPESPEYWVRCESLAGHVMRLQNYGEMHGGDHMALWNSCTTVAAYLNSQGRHKEAEILNKCTLAKRKASLGAEHLDTLINMGNLAMTYSYQGRLQEAETLGVHLAKVRKKVLGEEHPDRIIGMGNLALVYLKQGRLQDSELLWLQVVEALKRTLGEEHPQTFLSINNLALVYINQGRLQEAENLWTPLLELSKKTLGSDHLHTLHTMSNLASTYSKQGKLQAAENLGLRTLEKRNKVLGCEHPDTLGSMNVLAAIYGTQGRWKEAEILETQVLEARKILLGDEHPDSLLNKTNLTAIYLHLGRLQDAQMLGEQALEGRTRVLGEDHPDTVDSIGILSEVYWIQKRFQEAEKMQVHVFQMRRKILGDEHYLTLLSMVNLAHMYKKTDRNNDALFLLYEAIPKLEQLFGPNHPRTIWANAMLSKLRQDEDLEPKEAEMDTSTGERQVDTTSAQDESTPMASSP